MPTTDRHRLRHRNTIGRSAGPLFHQIVLCVLLSGCGVAQFATCAPHTKEEGAPTRNWGECFHQPASHAGISHSVYCLNEDTAKPPVLLLHELTGLTPGTLAYAEELSKDFMVYVPLLFGEKGRFSPSGGLLAYWGTAEWNTPLEGSMPIVNWLRGVVRDIGARHSQQHIGVIGNCMTGPLPIALLDNPQVGAAVVAQPALPMRFWFYTDEDKASLGLSGDDLRSARSSTAQIYGLRFETDCMADRTKLRTLREQFGDRFLNGEIPTREYQLDGKPTNAHSTLIGSWKAQAQDGQASRDARERVRAFLLQQLNETRPDG